MRFVNKIIVFKHNKVSAVAVYRVKTRHNGRFPFTFEVPLASGRQRVQLRVEFKTTRLQMP